MGNSLNKKEQKTFAFPFDKKKFMKENETLAAQYMEDREDKGDTIAADG